MISEEYVQQVVGISSETLLDLLRQRSEERPSELIYRFLSDDGREIESLTFAALDRQARAIAHLLQESGAYGQPVLLVLPPGLQFVSAFFGCLYAGAIATPAYPPASEKNALRLSSIAADARPFVGLTTSSILNSSRRSVAELITSAGIRWLTLDTLQEKRADAWQPPCIDADTLALLQYTSGSTAAPKGVMITHANLLHNQSLIQRAFGQTEQSVIVSWLPLYHDMGLIGAVLQPLYVGAECVLLSPMAFLQRPVRWLEVISKYRATTSGGPNFAFDLCARKVTPEQKRELDLSSWSVAFNGAEPILAGTLDRFSSEFEECGFRRSAFRPCYGLAEATLLVSAADATGPYIIEAEARSLELNRVEPPTSPATTRRLVSSGPPASGQAIAIVNPETLERCEPNQVGEIWFSGPGVSSGYWKRPDETRERLMASLPGDMNTYLRTGDLGFLDEHGLFVTGRLKELIIVHGLNYHPLDIEITAQKTNPALRAGCGAAFSIKEGGQQSIVLVQEIERDAFTLAESLFADIRDAVTRQHELSLDIIALVLPVSLPKTSSGKIRRAECREQFLAGELRIVAQWGNLGPRVEEKSRTVAHRKSIEGGPVSALENLLIRIWGDVLEVRSLDSGSNFFQAGGDSVSAAQVIARASRELAKEIPLHLLFDNPTVARFATALACIDAGLDKKPVLRRLGLKEAALSYSQQRIWIDEQLRAAQTVYNISMGLFISGDLDVSALQSSLNEIVRRHESLRTHFINDDGEPRLVIVPYLQLDVSLVDLSGLEQADVDARLRELLRAEAAKPFNLEQIPLVRGTLVRLGARRHVLVLIVHHMVFDGWSAAVMLRELSTLYAALAQGRPSPLEELPIQYADFAVRQRELLQGEVLEALLGYWRKRLASVPYHLQLPADHPRPAVNLHRGARCPLHLNAELSHRLATLGRQEDSTLFMTLAALFQILLARCSGQQEFLLGCPVANRSEVETQGLIGFLVNTVVLHCDLRDDLSFRPLLRRVRETVLEAHNHQDLPFEKLVEELRPEREPGSTPLFQVMLLLRQAEPVIEVEGLRLEPLKIETDVAMYDLTLELTESAEGLRGSFEYNVDLFNAATIERFAGHFLNLAGAVVEEKNASTPVSRLPLLSESDRRRLVVEWNDTRCNYGRAACLHELVEEQVERTPDAIAVSSTEGLLSYRELHARASQLGNWLQEQGVGPESRVGVCMTRSLEMVVALLGVLEAGAAYVPLDPGYPRERLVNMTQDAGLDIILTQQALAAEIPGMARLLCLDSQWEQVTACKSLTRHKAIPDNVAYLIYTSGSTGKPKGVMNSHRGIVNRLRWMRAHYEVGTADRFIQKTPFSFDVSVWEFFAPLISGSCLVMAKPEGHRDPTYLAELIADEQITIVHFVPAMLQPFLEQAEAQRCRSVRQFICSGEALTTELQERFFKIMSAHLDNLYGPTEAAVEVTAWRCRAGYERVPIGRPISNLCTYVLDRWQEPVPIGVSGELYIGGAGVARGYWRRSDLTAERFVPDPFSTLPGRRLYRTGDLVRWLPDGTVEFLGRLDDQVKIRGHRVEPAEITALLCEHPGVGQAVVRAWGHDASRRLVAYVVARAAGEPLQTSELRSYLKGRVPDYMMPSAFVLLEELPLTPSGKVNTSALPEVVREALEEGQRGGGKGVGGRREIEEMVAGVWAEVLGLEELGAEDNFFELGGHSLLATQVVARLSRQMGVRVALRELFEAPTLNRFALQVERALRGGSDTRQEPQIGKADRDSELPLSFAQQRLWFIDQFETESPAYNIHTPVRMQGRLDLTALERALSEIVRRHEVLRTTFPSECGHPVQRIHPSAALQISLTDLTVLPEEDREPEAHRLSVEAARIPFDLTEGPLLRASLLRVSADEHLLLFTMHHIISDGWSMGALVREVGQLYAAYTAGRDLLLPELPIQYADYAAWQRQYLQDEFLELELDYWREQLKGAPENIELLADRPRPPVKTYRGAIEMVELQPGLSSTLRDLSRKEGVTLFMTLLAGFQALLGRYTGQDDFVVGTPVANRTCVETERLIGCFVNTLALRADLNGDPTVKELLARVRETTLGAYAHQDVPFERVVEELQVVRDLSLSPVFQVMFALQNAPMDELSLEGLRVSIESCDTGTARFDLFLSLTETGDSITTVVEYNTDLFEPERVRRLLRHYEALLVGMAEDADRRVGSLPLLCEDERRQIEQWGSGTQEDIAAAAVHELFERQAALSPSATAVVFEEQSLTYSELNAKANQLAETLRGKGVTTETPVAVLMDRSFEMIISLLAILKSGAAYVPLNPAYPQQRLAFMIEDAAVSLLLTQKHWSEFISSLIVPTLTVDANELDAGQAGNPGRTILPDNIAYLTYTSGSTGQPKGVLVTHRGVLRLVARANYADFSREHVFMLAAPLAFDASTFEIWGALLNGATLKLLPPPQPSLEELGYYIRRYSVTTLWLTAGLFHQMVEYCLDDLRGVKQLLAGGDVLSSEHVRRALRDLPGCTLINGYGPTENTTFTCCYTMRAGANVRASIPIGRPISGTHVYVLDRYMQQVPVGVVGELYTGGAGVARGYWRRSDLTAERFVPDPFSTLPGRRLYRTGDLVRWLPDGTVEFLGRLDDQVKIRGHRVEPAEITALLCEHPGVGQAVVRAWGHDASRRLVAYVVARAAGEPLQTSELRSYLKGRVPDYMMPSAFVLLEELPLTPSGKVNTSALPEVVREAIEEGQRGGGKGVGGRREIEEMVAGVWAEVLGLEELAAEDNFFELGGHSLLATQVVARLSRQMGVRVALRELFEAPTLNRFALQVERALRGGSDTRHEPQIGKADRDSELPLSFAQQRLWFLEQLEPGNSAYAIPAAARLKGFLNYKALQQALSEIVRRHESLRTRFIRKGGRPIQLIHEATPVSLDSVDLTGLPDDERESAVNRLLRQEGARGFDLERGPLFRTQLLRLAEDHHVLIVSMHHIVSDGWSVGILIRELQHLYQAFVQGTPCALPDLPLQYVDYAVWQREYLDGKNLRPQLDYWKERLTGLMPLNLLADRQRDTAANGEAGIESLELSEELSARLRALSRREGVTLFMTLLAAFKLLLARHSGQKDVAVGTPVAGRSLVEWENLIGFFVNTLVMRTNLSGNPTFRQLLSRVRETALGAYAHQDAPFEKLVEELQPDRNLSRHPFFDIFFNHVNVPSTDAELTGLKIDLLDVAEGDSKFPLTVYTRDDNRQITLRVVYRQSLFYPERIRLLLDQYQEILSQITERADDPIASYSLITSRMLPLLPDPKAEPAAPHFDLVTEMFNRRVVESPHNVAVTQGGREWSYEELSESAHGIASALLNLGLKPGQTVAVCGEKSFGLIAGILAASLSGGVLFTLDRKLPAARQHSMFEIAGVKYVLYAGSLRQQDTWMFEHSGVDTLTLDDQSGSVVAHNGQTIRRENPESFERITLAEQFTADAAYIFFTSGTTGAPKGVLGCHQGLSHFITWQRKEFGIGPGDRSAQLTGLSFDVVLRDIFLPLTSGAALCLPDDEDAVVSGQVLTWLDRERVSVLHTVPSLAESWLMSPAYESSVTSLRIVFFAGEPLTSRLVESWREVTSSRCQIVNLYGPTETTLAKCFYRVPLDCLPGRQPVGKPIPQTQALILRDREQLCGVGEIGEVVLRTPFRSLGYVNAPEEFRRRFVRNPYRDEEQDLLYRTGDMGRYRSDGMIELLGRIDDQLKIRGHRIEPGEIDCLLRAHPAVGSAAVVARPCAGEDKRLVAYVALINNSSLSPTELRSYLRSQLPEYMIPATFVLLPALPLTPNGKVDRESLPDPEQPAGDGYEQPRDEIEELLAGIWSEVLGLELVGRDQNFFDLGGHSLVAIQVISRVREIFGVDLRVGTLFSTPTISGIAEAVRAAQRDHQTPSQSQLRHIEQGPLLPLSFAQQRLWFIDQLEPGGHAYLIPAAVRMSGELNDEALRRALFAIAQRHENLRTRFVNTDGTPMQVIDEEPGFEFRLADLSRESSGEELEARASDLLHEETRRAFDLSREHLFRALLIRLSAKEHILLLTVHHIVSDAWSMGVLLKEVKAFYQPYCDSTTPALPDLPVQYADYAAWQRDYLRGEMLERQLSYWRQQLQGAEPLELPTDHPRPPVQTYKGSAEPFVLSASLVKDIRHLGRHEGCTLFMTLLAAFQILLSKYSGQKDVLVGTPIAGRTHSDLEGLIGFFVNTLVMRTNMTGESTFREILQQVRESALGAYAHQDLPFEKLIEDLQPVRDPSRSPLFQVMFIFQHSSREEEEFKGLDVKPLEVEVSAAKFDLTLTVLGDTEELNCVIEYNTDLFERDRILRLIRHFNVVLEAITANPDQTFSTLALVAHDEREKILKDWNATEVKYTGEQHVARLFELQVARTPDRVAFIEGDRRLSYGELNRRANRLARHLKQSSLREESTAAVCMRRSPDMMVALLAILKAGGTYVPIDPELPGERIAMMLSDSKARLVITERSLSERVSKGDAEVIRLDADWGEIETYDSSNLSCRLGGDAALYLIYTSGSTGRPKGVLGTHGGTLNRFRWMWEAFPFEDGEVCSLKTSLSFVDSVWECFGPLLAGVPTVMIPETMVGNTEALVSRLAQENVTRIVLVPSLLESLVENYSNLAELLPALRFWVCSGETLAGQLAERFHAAMPRGRLINLYGCSEVAGDVTYHIAARTPSTKPVPIGRPVANTQIYILDEYMNPCGIGLPGQVYVGGAHLARGYWNRLDETADRFVPNPFATHPGQRLYRTGDLGRYAPSGEIEYLGRLDYQLKVRGYRIESGEIESILCQHPNVRMIQVVAADVGSSDKKLVAYVVLSETGESANRDLYDYAARFLPSYMIPSAFVPLEKFSLLPNGKINRRALPAVGRSHTLSVGTAAAASTPVETSLVEIWRDVLGLDQVGIYDNFFDLGGHSLALVKVRARIESRFGRRVSLPELFTYPTIAALSPRLLDPGTQNDTLAEVRQRSARQKESSWRRRQQRIEQRLKLQEIAS